MSWHISFPTQISCGAGDPSRALSSHTLRGMERCQEIPGWPCFSSNNAWQNFPGRGGIQPNHGMGSPLPGMALFCGWGGKKLTLLFNSGNNWAYAFMQLNEDAQHVPLPKEGHLSAMINAMPSRNTWGHLCQQEVCWLLQCEDWVVYPEGLNGGLEPVLTSLSAALVQGVNMLGEPAHKPSFLPVDLPPVHTERPLTQDLSSLQNIYINSPYHLAVEHPPTADSHISMTTEVWELLSHTMLDTSSQVFGNSLPKGPTYPALRVPSPTREEGSSKPVATFFQASLLVAMPDITKPIILTPEAACAPTNPPTKTPGADMGALPMEVILLQEEMNNVMGCLLMTRASLDTCWRKQVRWPTVKMRPKPLRSLGKQKPIVGQPLEKWNPIVWIMPSIS